MRVVASRNSVLLFCCCNWRSPLFFSVDFSASSSVSSGADKPVTDGYGSGERQRSPCCSPSSLDVFVVRTVRGAIFASFPSSSSSIVAFLWLVGVGRLAKCTRWLVPSPVSNLVRPFTCSVRVESLFHRDGDEPDRVEYTSKAQRESEEEERVLLQY